MNIMKSSLKVTIGELALIRIFVVIKGMGWDRIKTLVYDIKP